MFAPFTVLGAKDGDERDATLVTFPQRDWFVCWALSVTRRWYKREAAAEGAEWTGPRTLRFR